MRLRKRNFLLLELLLALSLIAGCALPLIRGPFYYCKAHLGASQELEIFLLSEKALSQIKKDLYHHKPSWKELTLARKSPLLLEEKAIHHTKLGTTFLEKRQIRSCRLKRDQTGNTWAKLTIEISYHFLGSKKAIKKYTHVITACQKNSL